MCIYVCVCLHVPSDHTSICTKDLMEERIGSEQGVQSHTNLTSVSCD